MCGRFNMYDLSGALLWLFGMSDGPEQSARYNITPSQHIAAVRAAAGDAQKALLRPYTSGGRMVVDKVSREVNSPRNDHPGCIKPIE